MYYMYVIYYHIVSPSIIRIPNSSNVIYISLINITFQINNIHRYYLPIIEHLQLHILNLYI